MGTHGGVRPVIVGLDVVEVGGRLERVVIPVEFLEPSKKTIVVRK